VAFGLQVSNLVNPVQRQPKACPCSMNVQHSLIVCKDVACW
jgi:hypothetical protein